VGEGVGQVAGGSRADGVDVELGLAGDAVEGAPGGLVEADVVRAVGQLEGEVAIALRLAHLALALELFQSSQFWNVTARSKTYAFSASSGCAGSGRGTPSRSHSSDRKGWQLARSPAPEPSQRRMNSSSGDVRAA